MHFKGKTVFITGASGFVGSNLARYLSNQRAQVHVAVRKNSDLWRIKDLKGKLRFHFLDINNIEQLKKTFLKIKPIYIFHLASYGAYSWQEDTGKMIETNIKGTLSVLEASLDVDYDCLINTGSSSEYGFQKTPMREDMAISPNSFYAATKASGTYLSSVFASKYKKPIITFRLFSVYGPYEDKNRLIPIAMKAAILGGELKLTTKNVRRDFIYVEDVINAYISVSNAKKLAGQIFNIGTGKQHGNWEIGKILGKISEKGFDISIGTYKERAWDSDFWVADISKSKNLLGWSPKYSLQEGLLETYKWFGNNLHFYT